MNEMRDRDEIRNELLLYNRQINDEQIHDLIRDIIAQQKVLDTLTDVQDETFNRRLYLRDYPAILTILEQYAALEEPSESERFNTISMLRMFLARMIEQTGRKTEEKTLDMSADMKMLNALLGMDGLNDDLKMK
ncbi:MAG: hypothetical protein IJI75_06310 [Solobacterium sp.]|nr:hypothetical protein [Solobacterium sp.]